MTEPVTAAHRWTLPAAASLAAAETVLLIAVVLDRGGPGAALFAAFLAVKLPFCWLAAARRPGAYLGLLLWEGVAVVTALTGRTDPELRILETGLAVTTIALLLASARLFPSVELPKP